jgi:hypothetical protein
MYDRLCRGTAPAATVMFDAIARAIPTDAAVFPYSRC